VVIVRQEAQLRVGWTQGCASWFPGRRVNVSPRCCPAVTGDLAPGFSCPSRYRPKRSLTRWAPQESNLRLHRHWLRSDPRAPIAPRGHTPVPRWSVDDVEPRYSDLARPRLLTDDSFCRHARGAGIRLQRGRWLCLRLHHPAVGGSRIVQRLPSSPPLAQQAGFEPAIATVWRPIVYGCVYLFTTAAMLLGRAVGRAARRLSVRPRPDG
jgi:hypothetical protein